MLRLKVEWLCVVRQTMAEGLQVILMNIEAYDAESLRKLVRLLEYENRLLKEKLKKENIPFDEVNPFEETIDNVEEYDPDQGERIVHGKKQKSGVSDTI